MAANRASHETVLAHRVRAARQEAGWTLRDLAQRSGVAVSTIQKIEAGQMVPSFVRLRERATRGAGSRTKGLLMAFKLLDMAQQRWRRLDGAHLLPLVRVGVKFVDGVRDPAQPITQSTDHLTGEAA